MNMIWDVIFKYPVTFAVTTILISWTIFILIVTYITVNIVTWII